MAGEGTLEEVTILDLEEREGGMQAGETRKQEAAHLCIHCATVFLEDLLCVAAIGVDTVPAIADGAGRRTSRHTDLWISGREACFEEE